MVDANENVQYAAMDWLRAHQDTIQKKLAARHPSAGSLVLHDLSSSYFEGTTCPPAKLGYSRDRRHGTLQVNYGLHHRCAGLFGGRLGARGQHHRQRDLQVRGERVHKDFGIEQLVMVGDRGMLSHKAIKEMRETEGIGWITALKSASIRWAPEWRHWCWRCFATTAGTADRPTRPKCDEPEYGAVAPLCAGRPPRRGHASWLGRLKRAAGTWWRHHLAHTGLELVSGRTDGGLQPASTTSVEAAIVVSWPNP